MKNLEKIHIKDALHPIIRDDEKITLPVACHIMSTRENDIFCKVLHDVTVQMDTFQIYLDVINLKYCKII